MIFLNKIFIIAGFIATVFSHAVDNQITFYGCPEECYTQEHPSCGGGHVYIKYFSALSTKLKNVDSFCGKNVIVMLADGRSDKLVKTTMVDTCSSCDPYHVDLSSYAFELLLSKSKGIAEVIWGIYSDSGSRLAGPYYNSISGAASSFGLSSSALKDAFDASARKLAQSGDVVGRLNSSGSSSGSGDDYHEAEPTTRRTTRKTTTKKSSTRKSSSYIRTTTRRTTTRRTTYKPPTYLPPKRTSRVAYPPKRTSRVAYPPKRTSRVAYPPKRTSRVSYPPKHTTQVAYPPKYTTTLPSKQAPTNLGLPPKQAPTNSGLPPKQAPTNLGLPPKQTNSKLPPKNAITKTVPPTNGSVETPVVAPNDQSNDYANKKGVDESSNEKKNNDGLGNTFGIVTAISGAIVGATGIGLLFMKKKNPSTYEGMKQKFPDAFSHVRRSLSRGATSIRRTVSRR